MITRLRPWGSHTSSTLVLSLLGTLAALGDAACSASSASQPPTAAGGGTATGGAAGATGAGGSGLVAGSGGDPGAIDVPDASARPLTGGGCSADLRSIVDADGKVVQACGADQGCAAGACIRACDAAASARGSLGCDFVVSTPSWVLGLTQPCFAVFVTNAWSRSVSISVTRAGQTLDVTRFARLPTTGSDATAWPSLPASGLPPDQIAVLFLSSDPQSGDGPHRFTCPITPAVDAATSIPDGFPVSNDATGRGQAFHVSTDAPVTAYALLPYGGSISYQPGAMLLMPTSAWGTNFLAVVPPRTNIAPNPSDPNIVDTGAQWGQIVAASDDTKVTLVSPVALPSGKNVPATPAGTVGTFTLSAGEYVQWQDTLDMSGATIESDKPIAFVGGVGGGCLVASDAADPLGATGCSSMPQQIPPVKALGSEYAVVPYASRVAGKAERVLYRIVGVVDGTTLTYDPPVPEAPATISRGRTVDFDTPVAFSVKSQDASHPFYVAQLMPGAPDGSQLGNAAFVGLLPPAQFLSKYIFFADPTYGTSSLVFVRAKGKSGFSDVTLDCAGKISGWKPIGSAGRYEMTNVDLVREGAPSGACSNGRHIATSDGSFGLVVWGLDTAAAYAYPAGGNAAFINSVVVKPTIR
jgi:hypothetical protein